MSQNCKAISPVFLLYVNVNCFAFVIRSLKLKLIKLICIPFCFLKCDFKSKYTKFFELELTGHHYWYVKIEAILMPLALCSIDCYFDSIFIFKTKMAIWTQICWKHACFAPARRVAKNFDRVVWHVSSEYDTNKACSRHIRIDCYYWLLPPISKWMSCST